MISAMSSNKYPNNNLFASLKEKVVNWMINQLHIVLQWNIYSGDTDGRVPVTSSRYSINTYNLPVVTPWRPWYSSQEVIFVLNQNFSPISIWAKTRSSYFYIEWHRQVGGYVVEYKGLTLTTVRGVGHLVPSYQPERALTMISSFLKGELPPPS